ncbi:MAG: hypothetical protein EOP87_02940, partial [Verrucomicrobiaceae bacterium]
GNPAELEKSLATRTATDSAGRPFYNPNPGPDGLNSQQKIITFIENHDGLNRFRVAGITEQRNRLAQALLLTLPGIPCLYYGTEYALADEAGKTGQDGESGRMMFYHKNGGPTVREVKSSAAFKEISQLAALRASMPVLRTGKLHPLWVDSGAGGTDDGVFAFARSADDGGTFAVVVVNASDKPRVTTDGTDHMRLPPGLKTEGKVLRPLLVTGPGPAPAVKDVPAAGQLDLAVPASGLVVYGAFDAR